MELYDNIEENTEKIGFWTRRVILGIALSAIMIYSYLSGALTETSMNETENILSEFFSFQSLKAASKELTLLVVVFTLFLIARGINDKLDR
jgi:hypothetical protein